MPRPSRKSEILAAAVSCFSEYGYSATRVKSIAERAGVSEAALYRHFPSVEELGAQIYLERFSLYAARIAEAVSAARASGDANGEAGQAHGARSPAERQLRAVVRASLTLFREDPDAFLFSLEVLPVFLRRLPEGLDYPIHQLERVIAEGQQDGTIRPGQPNLLASVFFGAVLRPIQTTRLAAPGALELAGTREHDLVLEDCAAAALRAG